MWKSRSEHQTDCGSDMHNSITGPFLKLSESRIPVYEAREQRSPVGTCCH